MQLIEMRTKLSCVVCLLLALTLAPDLSSAQRECRTPNNGRGLCVHFRRCTFVTSLYDKYGRSFPPDALSYLQRLHCDTIADQIYVCCSIFQVVPESDLNKLSFGRTTTTTTTTTTAPTATRRSIDFSQKSFERLSDSERQSRGLAILNATKCGPSSEFRVANGEEVQLREFPWMAVLQYDSDYPWNCGASLISDRFVLTAAHCVTGNSFNVIGVRLGEHNLTSETDCQQRGEKLICSPPPEDHSIKEFIVHPRYDKTNLLFDVALLRLERVVQFQKHIKPICLPITSLSRNSIKDQLYIVAGWGLTEHGSRTDVLLKASMTWMDVSECKKVYKSHHFTRNHMCIGSNTKGDSCKGDSGGPLFAKQLYQRSRPRYIQYGIVSGGTICTTKQTLPGVYTNVIDVLPWILSHIDEN